MIEKKTKVVHISTYSTGGAGRAAYRIHEALSKNGVSSTFLSLDSPDFRESNNELNEIIRSRKPSFIQRQKDRIRFRFKKHFGIESNLEKKITPEFNLLSPMLDCEFSSLPFSEYNIWENPIVKNADIIHLHWIAGVIDYSSFFKNNNKPIVWTLHDMNPFQGLFHYKEDQERNWELAGNLNRKINAIKKKAILKRKAKLEMVSPSKWLLNEASNSVTFNNIKGNCIPYPLNTTLFFPKVNSHFKSENDIPEKNAILLFVAQSVNNRRKGLDLLIGALNSIKQFPITLLVLGNSDDINIDGMDIRKLGSINEDEKLAYYYSNSDAFILPSREDNLPNVMLESLSCGTPVIGFSVGGIKDHIIDYKTGLLVKELSRNSLAKTIETFCEKKEMFNREEIRKYGIDNFSETLIANKYLKVYTDIFNNEKGNA
jgi:glycosyltransferase involved in cell wall biosynthesis